MSETTEVVPELDPNARYTFISYLPSEETSNCGCGCRGYTYHESEFTFEQRLTQTELVSRLTDAKLSKRYEDLEIKFFDEKFPSQPDEYNDAEYEAFLAYEAHRKTLETKIWALVNESEPIVKAAREAKAKKLAAEAAERERIRLANEEYARLQKKFTKEKTP